MKPAPCYRSVPTKVHATAEQLRQARLGQRTCPTYLVSLNIASFAGSAGILPARQIVAKMAALRSGRVTRTHLALLTSSQNPKWAK